MEIWIYYLDENGTAQILVWEAETQNEALFLADDVCRKGALVPNEGKLIPSHRIMVVRFMGEEKTGNQEEAKEQKDITTNSTRVSLERFAFDLKSMSAEPCPVGQKCELLSKLADKLDGILKNAPARNR